MACSTTGNETSIFVIVTAPAERCGPYTAV